MRPIALQLGTTCRTQFTSFHCQENDDLFPANHTLGFTSCSLLGEGLHIRFHLI